MKVIIAGSRHLTPSVAYKAVEEAAADYQAATGEEITCVVSGGARGVDRAGDIWARRNRIACERYAAEWGKHGRSAGPIRNRKMAGLAQALIAVWDGKSKGTKNMIDQMMRQEKYVWIHLINESI